MQIDPRRLTVLLTVHRAGGVIAAAAQSHLSPSAVSQQIAKLERELGFPVLDRQPSGSVLTPVGRLLVEAAERIEAELADVRQAVAGMGGEPSGKVVIGGFRSALRGLVLPLVQELRGRLPNVDVHVLESETETGATELRNGVLDLLLAEADAPVGRTQPRGTRDITLLDDPWLVAVPASMPRPRTTTDLSHLDWLAVDESAAAHGATQRLMSQLGVTTPAPHRYSDYDIALAMVDAGLGAALLPALAMSTTTSIPQGVQVVAIPGLERRIIIARHRLGRSGPNPVTVQVLDELIQHAARVAGAHR
ncbi:LysR family transcriptional regulator [Nocardioides sp.]|uniref:LysR family transcriptional regulator n=1 Tax=Nocardioides sp. TaxID=35761 RepID=UPI0035AF10FF